VSLNISYWGFLSRNILRIFLSVGQIDRQVPFRRILPSRMFSLDVAN